MKKFIEFYLVNIILFLIGFILSVTPIIFFPDFAFNFVTIKTFFFFLITEIVFFLYLFLILFLPEYRPKKNYILYSFFAFVLVNILSASLGEYPILSFWSGMSRMDGVILLIHLFLFLLVTVCVVRSKKNLILLIWTSVISATVVALSSYFEITGIWSFNLSGNHGSSGFAGNDSYTAAYLLFNLFFIMCLFFETNNKKIKYFLVAFFFFIFFSPVFFNFNIFLGSFDLNYFLHNPFYILGTARGASMSLFLGIVLTFLLFFTNYNKKLIRVIFKILTIMLFITIILIIFLIKSPGTNFYKRFDNETGGYRFIYWHQAIEGFKEKPILGWGPSIFNKVNEKYYDPTVFEKTNSSERWSDNPHNKILEVLVNTGVLGLITYLGIFVFSILLLWRSPHISHGIKSILSGLFLAYFLQNLLFFDILVSYLMFVFLIAIILILSRNSEELPTVNILIENRYLKKNFIIVGLLLGFFCVCSILYFVVLPFKKTNNYIKFTKMSPRDRFAFYEKNRLLSPFGGSTNEIFYGLFVYAQYMNSYNLYDLKKEKDVTIYVNDIDATIQNIENSFGLNGEVFKGRFVISQLYEIRQFFIESSPDVIKKMKENGKRGIILSPGNPLCYLAYAKPFFYEKNYREAINVLDRGVLINPKIKDLHESIIDIARMTGDKKLIEEKIQRAEKNIPGVNFR